MKKKVIISTKSERFRKKNKNEKQIESRASEELAQEVASTGIF